MTHSPRFVHDCVNPNCCRFAGLTPKSDVYVYTSMLGEPGLIMRQSDDGPDYRSWPTLHLAGLSAKHDDEVRLALQLADSVW